MSTGKLASNGCAVSAVSTQEGTPGPISRRGFVGAAAGIAATAPLLGTSALSFAQDSASGAPSDPGFLQLSQRLTGRTTLSSETAGRLGQGLAQMEGFGRKLSALRQFVAQQPQGSPDALFAAIDAQGGDIAEAAHKILSAWYLGVVDDNPQARVYLYESALMFDPVRSLVAVPSYCHGRPLYWAQDPPGLSTASSAGSGGAAGPNAAAQSGNAAGGSATPAT